MEFFFLKKNHKKSLLIKNFGDIFTKIWKPQAPIPRGENTRTRKNPKSKTRPRPRPRNVYPEPAPTPTFAPRLHHYLVCFAYAYAVYDDWLCVMILIIIGPARNQINQGGNVSHMWNKVIMKRSSLIYMRHDIPHLNIFIALQIRSALS